MQYIAGGATQNTVRVAQWMLRNEGATSYVGAVGKDEYAEKMRSVCGKDGVKVRARATHLRASRHRAHVHKPGVQCTAHRVVQQHVLACIHRGAAGMR